MYNRCPHFNEGILPIFPIKIRNGRRRRVHGVIIQLSIYFIISLLILLPKKSSAAGPPYETAYACEGKTLTISCDPGYLISLIRANYGRFSITICNDHGNVEWSVNCMSPKSLRVLHSKCTHKQNCSVLASTNMFGDPCPGTHKYLEAHYQCVSAAQTSTTTTRPSPPWLITNSPNVWSTSTIAATVITSSPKSTSGHQTPTTVRIGSIHQMVLQQKPPPQMKGHEIPGASAAVGGSVAGNGAPSHTNIHLAGGRPPFVDPFDTRNPGSRTTNSSFTNRGGVLQSSRTNPNNSSSNNSPEKDEGTVVNGTTLNRTGLLVTPASPIDNTSQDHPANQPNRNDDSSMYNHQTFTTQSSVLSNANNNNYDVNVDTSYYCGPTTIRNLFWNVTRVGEVNVQPCPGGAFGIAKWRCILQQIPQSLNRSKSHVTVNDCISQHCENQLEMNQFQHRAGWHPQTPDLTQCRSVWINNLEISVNQRDSSLISIANDLSQITSSKTLYGGDMLVTTKIIQTMSEKMAYDIETFPDQKQREAIITELLSGVVKTGSNLLDISHERTWLDLSFEDQMRVATSLLTGLEDNAFLLADSIIRERTVVQKVKNILLSIRVLEARNIVGNEIFPDGKVEQWQISDDRIELPRGALIENNDGGLVRIVFVAFDRLETILKPWLNHLDVKYAKSEMQQNQSKNAGIQHNRILNSKVISASLGKGRHIQLSQPIRLVLRHLKVENVTNPVCVFWNYIDHAWSEDGCYLEHTNHSHTICMCNHLTNFAILMDTTDDTAPSLLSLFNNNIRILIYISIAICIIFIIIAILTLKLFNGIFVKSSRSSVYKNIYVCLFIIEVLFLFGIEQSETNVLCGFTTAFLHCFVLSAIAWLFFEGFQLYLRLTTDDMFIEVETSSKLIWYYLLSYGLSFTIVAISLAIDPGTYTQTDFCVLMEPNALFYTTFLAPVVIFVMGANSYSILSAYIMCKKNKTALKSKEHSRLASISFDLRCSFLFLTILTTDWIFAYLYLRKAKVEENVSILYGYIFIATNSILGVYIFIFHCIQNEKIRQEYRKYIRQYSCLPKCLRCSKVSISSSTSQHQHYGTASNKKNPMVLPSQQSISSNPSILPSTPYARDDTDVHSCKNDDSAVVAASVPGDHHHHRSNMFIDQAIDASGTLRGFNNSSAIVSGGGHISPVSSAGSTHLIFNSTQNESSQDWSFQIPKPGQYYPAHSSNGEFNGRNVNTYDAKYLNYDCRAKRTKQYPVGGATIRGHHASSMGAHTPQHHHEYFYWTENNSSPKKRINNGDLKASAQNADGVHAAYPSYKKTPRHYSNPSGGGDDSKLASDCDFTDLDPCRYHCPSDDDCADSHLALPRATMKGSVSERVSAPDKHFEGFPAGFRAQRYRQRYLGNSFAEAVALPPVPNQEPISSSYYSHSPTACMDEPVYEEILSNRASDLHGESTEEEDDRDDSGSRTGGEERFSRMRRMLSSKEDSGLGGMEPLRQSFNRYQVNPSEFDYPAPTTKGMKNPSSNSGRIGSDNSFNNVWSQQQQQPSTQQQLQTQPVVGRTLSAMLDENNTVVCYLEPLRK